MCAVWNSLQRGIQTLYPRTKPTLVDAASMGCCESQKLTVVETKFWNEVKTKFRDAYYMEFWTWINWLMCSESQGSKKKVVGWRVGSWWMACMCWRIWSTRKIWALGEQDGNWNVVTWHSSPHANITLWALLVHPVSWRTQFTTPA